MTVVLILVGWLLVSVAVGVLVGRIIDQRDPVDRHAEALRRLGEEREVRK